MKANMSPAALLRLWSLPITLTLLVFISNVPHKASAKKGYTCEYARIPLRTMWLTEESSVCVVPFCGEEGPGYTLEWVPTCMACDQSAWDGTDLQIEKTDVCPTELGECVKGHCCPKEGDTWYKQNFKKDWTGINTSSQITVGTYDESAPTSCGGTPAEARQYLQQQAPTLADIVTVPPQMSGSWPFKDHPGSQTCYANNNLCYMITDQQDKMWHVALWGTCGGYTQCMYNGPDNPSTDYYSPEATRVLGAGFFDANQCLGQSEVMIAAGTTPDCLSVAGGDGTEQNGMNCCPHPCEKAVDWCGSNDHAHFNVGAETYQKMCPNGTPCTVKLVVPYLCAWNPPVNPYKGDWTPRYDFGQAQGSAAVHPVRDPYPEPSCIREDPTEAPPFTTEAPPPTSNPSNPDGEQSSTRHIQSDSAATTGVSLMGWMVASFVGVVSVIMTAL